MIILANTTDKLDLVTDGTCDLDISIHYVDAPVSSLTTTPGRQNTNITTATTTDVLAAPAGSTFRNAKSVFIRNAHATLAVGVIPRYNQNGTPFELHKVVLNPGDLLEFIEGVGWFYIAAASITVLRRVLEADQAGQNVATAQPFFPSNGSVTVQGNTTYYMTGMISITRAAGAVSHDTSILFGGTATLTSIQYNVVSYTGETEALLAAARVVSRVATATLVKATSTTATEALSFLIHGIVRINVGGTFIPQFKYSTAPGGAPTVKKDSYLYLEPYGVGTFASQGTWA